MKKYILEICVDSLESALAAARAGASRLELCSNLIIGCTTPDIHLFRMIREKTDIPIHVLIRPRYGDFLYTEYEYELMSRQIKQFVEEGADGFAIGSLSESGALNLTQMRGMIEAAQGKNITLHRAFDVCKDPYKTLDAAKNLGVSCILTSGQMRNCFDGRKLLKKLTEQAGNEITIMVGSGVSPSILDSLYACVNTNAFHMSAKVSIDSGMKYQNPRVSMGVPGISEYVVWRTDENLVKQAIQVLDRIFV